MTGEVFDYAVSELTSKGRRFAEKRHPYRTDFERDRDRIIHSEAFRRLEGKRQVFTPGLNDNYRNRLTHSIEVAQIGRTIAKALALNENLTEAICLAHDLGHPPFGHLGERILDGLMVDKGGFEHNRQSLRIVDLLEHPYPDFSGLNLMYETRLGLAKHIGPFDRPVVGFFREKNCSLEGQACVVADRIAYNCHDLEDGMRAGLIVAELIDDLQIVADAQKQIDISSIEDQSMIRTRTAKAIIDILASDCIEASRKALAESRLKSVDEVYNHKGSLIVISDKAQVKLQELEKFLFENLYRNNAVTEGTEEIQAGVERLFDRLISRPEMMPLFYQRLVEKEGLHRTACDYIGGMTDRFCLKMIDEI
jgi:dGTPase